MSPEGKKGRDPRVTIVDDDPSVVRALARLCRSEGYAVLTYGSAEDFLEAGGPGQTDCLILDVQLPGLSGPDLQAYLSKAEQSVPIIFITAFDGERLEKQAIDSGARAFFRKPLDSDRLLGTLQAILAG